MVTKILQLLNTCVIEVNELGEAAKRPFQSLIAQVH